MAIKTNHSTIKSLFEQNHTFQVPKYQRGYAWEEEAIEDFTDDIGKCLAARLAGGVRHHFFGGVVTTKRDVPNSGRSNYEVIDGQQRLASFRMLAAAIVLAMENVVVELAAKNSLAPDEEKVKEFLTTTVETLRSLYLLYNDNIQLKYVQVPRLTLSQADDEFYQGLLEGEEPVATRASHERLQSAWNHLRKFIDTMVSQPTSVMDRATRLNHLVTNVLGEDCTVIFMNSETRSEAYQIFQVLNDRGVHLTDGDLLRASTMEMLDQPSAPKLLQIQMKVGNHWDRVLALPPKSIDDYLRWYFSSVEGQRPRSSNLADQFLSARFPPHQKAVGEKEAKVLLKEVAQLDTEFVILNMLNEGEWPYSTPDNVARWDRERVRMLVTHLSHTNAMPLLLSLRLLDAKNFAEAVAALERFVFRYKTIGRAHISPATALYIQQAKLVRDAPKSYKVAKLRNELRTLAQKAVPDSVFEANLRALRYSTAQGNGLLRYMFITLEDHSAWFDQGAQGAPKCKDKSMIFDFANTTLEHIYPQSPKAGEKNASLEKVKHEIGNLTIFGPGDNDGLGNKSFGDKLDVLKNSKLRLTREVGANTNWTSALVNTRTERLVQMALKVFVP